MAALLVAAGCSAPTKKPATDVTFAVIGNTSPASPFTGHPERIEPVFESINRENPMLVIHTGNVIQGGSGSMGVGPGDIARQFRKFFEQKKRLAPILHVIAGTRDIYDGSLDLFRRYVGDKLYYSFNYGTVHFIILSIMDGDRQIDPEQIQWLADDLARHRSDGAIFVFTHHPVLAPPYSGIRCLDADRLHELFVNHSVTAVFSGSAKRLYDFTKDGIRYITAGCGGYNLEDRDWSAAQYYIVRYDGTKLSIRPARVNVTTGACTFR